MTTPRVLFGDTLAAVIAWLDTALDDVGHAATPVHRRIPTPRPAAMVVLSDTGGTGRTRVSERVQVSVDCWAPDPAAAHDLAQQVRSLLGQMPGDVIGGIPVYRVDEVSRPTWQPDPLSTTPRYAFTVSVHVRGAAA